MNYSACKERLHKGIGDHYRLPVRPCVWATLVWNPAVLILNVTKIILWYVHSTAHDMHMSHEISDDYRYLINYPV